MAMAMTIELNFPMFSYCVLCARYTNRAVFRWVRTKEMPTNCASLKQITHKHFLRQKQAWIVDFHGISCKKKKTPDGSELNCTTYFELATLVLSNHTHSYTQLLDAAWVCFNCMCFCCTVLSAQTHPHEEWVQQEIHTYLSSRKFIPCTQWTIRSSEATQSCRDNNNNNETKIIM